MLYTLYCSDISYTITCHIASSDALHTQLAALKTKLESDIGTEHTLIRSKLHADVQKLRTDMNLLKSMSGSEEDQISSDLGYEKVEQDKMNHDSSTRLTKQEGVIGKGETLLDGKIHVLLTGLAATKQKLAEEMARVASERSADEAAWRSKIFSDANATQVCQIACRVDVHARSHLTYIPGLF
jgi:hypothetical protein